MLDVNLLRYFTDAKAFKNTYSALPTELFSIDVVTMLKWFQLYYKRYPEDNHVVVDKLSMLMKLDKGTDKSTYDTTKAILDNLRIPIDLTVKANIMEQLEERRLAGEVGLLLERFNNGEEVDLSTEVLLKASESHKRRKIKHQGHWEDGDVWAMVQADADNSGYLFTFLPRTFYMQIKGINEGDNICVAAPTNQGKTSFLVNVAVDFAIQRKEMYEKYLSSLDTEQMDDPMEFRPVLVLLNESNAKRVTPRVYQTALGVDRKQMFNWGADGTLEKRYIEKMGRRDAIRLVNIHGLSINDIAKVIEAHNPFLVITDMTGRIKANGNGSGMNDVSQLEHVWNSMRELSTMLNFIHVGTVQISKEGFDTLYPTIDAVQGSKVGIQTTWDLAIFIGGMLQPTEGAEGQRGISTPKSKLARANCNDYIKEVTHFDSQLNTWKLPEE